MPIDFSNIPDEIPQNAGPDLSAIPNADLQNSQSEAKTQLGQAWETCQEIGNVYPLAETAAHLVTSLYGNAVAGLGGLASLPFGVETSKKVINTINKWTVYQPQTEAGTKLSQTALYPLAKLEQAGTAISKEVMDRSGNPYLATAAYTAIVGAPAIIGLRFLPKAIQGKITASSSWRRMTIKERGVVIQSLEETIRKNPKMTEGELVRKSDYFRAEALKKRAEGEKAVPVKPKPVKVSPARKAEMEKAEKFNREVSEIVRNETDLTPAEIGSVFFDEIKKDLTTKADSFHEQGYYPTTEELISIDFKDHIDLSLKYLHDLVKEGEPGKRIRIVDYDGTEKWVAVSTTYPDFMRDKGLTEKQVTMALNKAIAGEKLGTKQTEIVRDALEYAQETFLEEVDRAGGDYDTAEASIEKAIDALFKKPELLKETKIHLAKIRKGLKPIKIAAKKQIRIATGQIKIDKMVEGLTERTALADQIRFEVRAARDAFRAGKVEATEVHKKKAITLYRRRERLRAIRDYLVIPESIMKKLTKGRDIGLMSDWEFKQYKDSLLFKSVELTKQAEAKAKLMKLISDKRLRKVDNYRRALELPPIGKMTTAQLGEFETLLEPFAEDDIFLNERELETVDRTDLKGIRTWREARLKLAEETGATLEDIESIKVTELDEYRYDTALAERNPFYRMLVTESVRKMLEADARYYEVETKAIKLAKKAEKSRKRGLLERAIPQDKQIMEYLEAHKEFKTELAKEMTPEQLDYAHYIEEYFENALEYLIKTQALTKGRENYFVHMRRTFLEEVRESGLKKAFQSIYRNYIQDEAVFTILDEDTGNILPLEKFFQFSLHRSGELLPTSNITKAFTAYVKMFERKMAYDELIPKMDIYAQALTPQVFTLRGLEVDRSIKKFVYKYINNKKGRRIRWISKQNGKIDMTIRAVRTFTTILDLGLNIPVSLASIIGEQATTFEGLGIKKSALGVTRLRTKKGKQIVKDNKAFIGKSVFAELAEPGKLITERLMEGVFGLFRLATVTANKQFLLGSLTKDEFQSGKISTNRLAELRVDMGRWRKVTGAESLVGGTSAGGAAIQYKTWAVPILSTTLRDIKIFVKDLKKPGKKLTTKEAKELWRFIAVGSLVAIVGGLIIGEKDDRSFLGQMKAKAYRELNTLMQGIGPGLWLSVPRVAVFVEQLGENFQDILTLEKYKTRKGLKGVEGLKRQLTPVVVKQATRKKKSKRIR